MPITFVGCTADPMVSYSLTYSLSGGIRAAAGFKNRPGFVPGQWGLIELPAAEWNGLVFVDGSGAAGPLGDSLGTLADCGSPDVHWRIVAPSGQFNMRSSPWHRIRSCGLRDCPRSSR